MKNIKLLQATKIDGVTKKMLQEIDTDPGRATRGVARGGRLWKVLNYDLGIGKFHVVDHDGFQQVWNKTKVACFYA
jgi:hypothetical protein